MAVSFATIIELLGDGGDVLQHTVAAGTGISIGTLMVFSSDPRVIIASAVQDATIATRRPFAGIAAAEKTATDGKVRIGVYTNGTFDVYCGSNAAVLVQLSAIGGANIITPAASADLISGQVVCKNLETGAAD